MIKRLIPILVGVMLTALSLQALSFPETQPYVEPLGSWATVITFVPAIIGFIVSIFCGSKSKKEDRPQPAGLLVVNIGTEPMIRKVLQSGKVLKFGSGEKDNLRIDIPSVKENQLLIRVKKDVCIVSNICCPHGAHLNRQAMQRDKNYNVYAGDVVQIGKIKLNFLKEE